MESYEHGKLALSAGSYMLKWLTLNKYVRMDNLRFVPGDRVNIFISVESVIRNLFRTRELPTIAEMFKQQMVLEIESSILNLAAHYRAYFLKEKCIPKVYLYCTDLNDLPQQMEVYNPNYRSYYKNKYMQDPHFSRTGELFRTIILPEIQLILNYVQDCYLIVAKNFDGSLIPRIVADFDESKNVVITRDYFDTLYLFDPRFMVLYIHRDYRDLKVFSTVGEICSQLVELRDAFEGNIFNSEMYFRLLMSVVGDKYRNIRTSKRFGLISLMKIIRAGIADGSLLSEFSSIDSIIDLFPERHRADIKNAFQCMSIDTQMSLLSETDIDAVKSQIIDKSDPKSVESLNNRRFLECPINLPMLLG